MTVTLCHTRVIIESPYAGDVARNTRYARACMLDSIRRGEAPYCSHLLYTQVLNDLDRLERRLGIEAGLLWGQAAHKTVVYIDFGISDGMWHGIRRADEEGREIEFRILPHWETLVPE